MTTEPAINKSQFAFGISVLPVSVTETDIEHGGARNCEGCAIARALNRALPRLGFVDCYVRLSPYAAFTEALGLEIFTHWPHRSVGRIPAGDLPAGLVEWAIDFDEWAEFHEYGSVEAWREGEGKTDTEEYWPPFRPEPVSFVFNFGKLIQD